MPFRSRDGISPELCKFIGPSKVKGAGKTGCTLHPRSHVPKSACFGAHEHTGSAEAVRPSLRNGFTTYTRSPWRPGVACHHHPEKRQLLRDLTPTLGRRDHTISPYAAAPFVIGTSASTASRPAFVTIASRPFGWDGTAGKLHRFDSEIKNYLRKSEYFSSLGRRA